MTWIGGAALYAADWDSIREAATQAETSNNAAMTSGTTTSRPDPRGSPPAGGGNVYNDDDMSTRETFNAYRRDPERARFKRQRSRAKRQRRQERKAIERRLAEDRAQRNLIPFHEGGPHCLENERLKEEIRYMRNHHDNDWFLHDGNVNFCRDFNLFRTYRPIQTSAVMADKRRVVTVLGIGKVDIELKPGPGNLSSRNLLQITALHIPASRCNGISLPLLEEAGMTMMMRKGDIVGVSFVDSRRSVFAVNGSSGKLMACTPGAPDDFEHSEHFILEPVCIHADRDEIAELAPEGNFRPEEGNIIFNYRGDSC